MGLRKIERFELLQDPVPPQPAIPARMFCVPKVPPPGGGGPSLPPPYTPPGSGGTAPPCPITITVPPCVTYTNPLTNIEQTFCTPRTIQCPP